MNKLQFAQLVCLIVARTGRELTMHDIADLEVLTKVAPEHEICNLVEMNNCNLVEMNNMLTAMRDGRKIDAIKAHRALTQMGLKESKNAVELVMNKSASL